MGLARVGRDVSVHRRHVEVLGVATTMPAFRGSIVEVTADGSVLLVRHRKKGTQHWVPRDAVTVHRDPPRRRGR